MISEKLKNAAILNESSKTSFSSRHNDYDTFVETTASFYYFISFCFSQASYEL